MICRVAFHDSGAQPITSEGAVAFRAWIKSMPGFVSGWHAQDPATGRQVSFTIWESEEHMRALRDKVPPGGAMGMKPVQQDVFSVVCEF